jgi:hypothetical protein
MMALRHRREWLRQEFGADRGRAVLLAHVLEDLQGFPEPGPHSLGLAEGAGEAAIWTTLADAWIHEQAAPDPQAAEGSRK